MDRSTEFNLRVERYKKNYGLNVDLQNTLILDDNFLFTHEALYITTDDKLIDIPYYKINNVALNSDGSLEFHMNDTSQTLYVKDDNLIPDKACDLFNQIVELNRSANDSSDGQMKHEKESDVPQGKTESIYGTVFIIVVMGLLLLAFVTCTRYCSEESKRIKGEQATADSLELALLRGRAELAEINNLLGKSSNTTERLDGAESSNRSASYGDDLSHIIVSRKYQINKGMYFGCKQQGYFHELVNFAVQGDKTNFNTLLNAGLLNGECVYFTQGETVTLRETNYDKTEVRVSRAGMNTTYWTAVEAIE